MRVHLFTHTDRSVEVDLQTLGSALSATTLEKVDFLRTSQAEAEDDAIRHIGSAEFTAAQLDEVERAIA